MVRGAAYGVELRCCPHRCELLFHVGMIVFARNEKQHTTRLCSLGLFTVGKMIQPVMGQPFLMIPFLIELSDCASKL